MRCRDTEVMQGYGWWDEYNTQLFRLDRSDSCPRSRLVLKDNQLYPLAKRQIAVLMQHLHHILDRVVSRYQLELVLFLVARCEEDGCLERAWVKATARGV